MNFKQWLLLTESKKPSEIARELTGNNETLFNQIKSIIPTDIKQDLQAKLLPITAFYHKKQKNLEILKQNINDYAELVKNQKMPLISVDDHGNIEGEFKDYLHWINIVHGKKFEHHVSQTPIKQNLEDQELITQSNDGNIKVYKANSMEQCITLGKGEKFCISNPNPSHNMFYDYRNDKISTFYFVYDNTRNDDLAIVVVDATENGIEITDRKNQTAKTMLDPYRPVRIKSNPDLYFKYLQEHGIDTTIFKNIPRTQEEIDLYNKIGYQQSSLQHFKQLTPDEMWKYIGMGHKLTDEQFDFLFDNNLMEFVKKYCKKGNPISKHQLQKIKNKKDLKDTYIHNRLLNMPEQGNEREWIVGSDLLSKMELDLLSDKEKQDYYAKGFPISKSLIDDNLTTFKKAYKYNGMPFNTLVYAIQLNALDIVKYILDELDYEMLPKEALDSAIDPNHIELPMLKYLTEKKIDISDNFIQKAVVAKRFDLLNYIYFERKLPISKPMFTMIKDYLSLMYDTPQSQKFLQDLSKNIED